jgi:hypothetical protein
MGRAEGTITSAVFTPSGYAPRWRRANARAGEEENVFKRTISLGLVAVATIVVAAACDSKPAGAASTVPSPGASASASASSASAPTGAASGLPSFALPSGAKDLEALLPDTLCGLPAVKFSMSGAQFAATADEEFTKTLSDLGKSPSDVSFAAAGSSNGECGAGIFRINGADQTRLQEVFLDASKSDGATYTAGNVGGRSVFVITTPGEDGKQYVYFKGDAVLFVQAPDETKAGEILRLLP